MSKHILRHEKTFSYAVTGRAGTLSGEVINGTAAEKKAFVALFKFYDQEGKLITGPYAGLSFSRIGAYRYIAGGTPDSPGKFSIKLSFPENAAKMTLVLSSWKHDGPIALSGNITIKGDLKFIPAPPKESHKTTAAPLPPLKLDTCFQFNFPITSTYKAIDYKVESEHVYTLDVHVASKDSPKEKSFLIQVSFLDKDARPLPPAPRDFSVSSKYGHFAYFNEGKGRMQFTAPLGAQLFRVTVHPWNAKTGTIELGQNLTLTGLSQTVITQTLKNEFEKLLENADPDGTFVCIYTGTKRIGEGNRANRSMMFAKESAALGISTIYTYSPSAGDIDFSLTNSHLLQIPLDRFDAMAGEIAARIPCREKLFLGSFPDHVLCRNIGLFRQLGWKYVYECRDDWEEFAAVGSASWYDEAFERFATEQADHVFCVSPMLQTKMQRYTHNPEKVHLSPNATTHDFLDAALKIRGTLKARAQKIIKRKPRIGYFGHLTDHWFDWGALLQAAKAFPDAVFEVIGFDMPDISLPENITYLGSKPHDEIVKIASQWDVGLIPFKHGKLSRAVDPIKVYEYLALGIKVVSVPMGRLDEFPLVFCYDEFGLVGAIHKALEYKPTAKDWRAIKDILAQSTWRERYIELLTKSGMTLGGRS